VSFDANAHRQTSLENWEEAASGWVRRQELMREFAAPVSHWMVDAIGAQPGQRLLELAAGLGETGLLAAELVAPMGGVIVSDQAEAMLAGARERAVELGLSNIEFQVLNAEWIDLPVASVDAVLCRWGYMLMADPAAALAETRRVLRPGGRVALAVWDALERNPWAQLPARELTERRLTAQQQGSDEQASQQSGGQPQGASGPQPSPGPFALGSVERLRELLAQAGFAEVTVEAIDLVRRHLGFDELWDTTLDLSRNFHDAVLSLPAAEIPAVRLSLAERFAPYTATDGTLEIPGRSLVARAEA
jgi:ubiquinone/menaquinone biosynthesis C-methylase UbiE